MLRATRCEERVEAEGLKDSAKSVNKARVRGAFRRLRR